MTEPEPVPAHPLWPHLRKVATAHHRVHEHHRHVAHQAHTDLDEQRAQLPAPEPTSTPTPDGAAEGTDHVPG